MTVKNYLIRRESEKRKKEKEDRKVFKKRMKFFLGFFLLLIVILVTSRLSREVLLSTNSNQTVGEIISVRHQSFSIPMDGGVNTYIIEYRFYLDETEIIGIQEVSSSELNDYFDFNPKVGDLVSIMYSELSPTTNEIKQLE